MADSEVELYTAPWVAQTRARAYFGPISVHMFLPDSRVTRENREEEWTLAEMELLRRLRERASELGANAVVGLEVSLDPFAVSWLGSPGLSLNAVGTAALLEPI